jgi:hypothetical protein
MTEKITPEDLNRFLLDNSDDENFEMISLDIRSIVCQHKIRKQKLINARFPKERYIHRRLKGHRRIIRDYFSNTKHSHTSKI